MLRTARRNADSSTKVLTPSRFEIFTAVFIDMPVLFGTTTCKLVFTDDKEGCTVSTFSVQGVQGTLFFNL
jgi:hypothetical protein